MHNLGEYHPITFATPFLPALTATRLVTTNPATGILEKIQKGRAESISKEEILRILQGTLTDVECRHTLYEEQISMRSNVNCSDSH